MSDVGDVLLASFAIVMMIVLLFMFASLVTTRVQYDVTVTNQSIKSISDSSIVKGKVSGNFLMMTGFISEEAQFYYYTGTNVFRLEHAPAKSSTIEMDENISPYVIIRKFTPVCKGVLVDIKLASSLDCNTYDREYKMYEFHVPSETIISEYNLDSNMRT